MSFIETSKFSRFLPYLKLLLATSIIGSTVVAGKMISESLPIMLSSCLRFAIASPILLGALYFSEGGLKLPSHKTLTTLFFQAFSGVFLFSMLLLYGLQHTGAIEAGLILGTLPAVTAILAKIVLREKLTGLQKLGIICSVLGAAFLNAFTNNTSSGSSFSFVGIALIFGAIFCEALFIVLGKYIGNQVSSLTITTLANVFGFILFFPFALWEAQHFNFYQTDRYDWLLIIYFGIIVSVISFWLFYSGLSKLPASVAGGFMAFLPLSALVLSSVILDEPILSWHLIAGASIIMGIFLMTFRKE